MSKRTSTSNDHHLARRGKHRKEPIERSLSSDSGLDSEFIAESIKESIISESPSFLLPTETDTDLPTKAQDQQTDKRNEFDNEESGLESPSDHLQPDNVTKKRSVVTKKIRSPIPYVRPKPPRPVTPKAVTPVPVEEPVLDQDLPEETTTSPVMDKYTPNMSMPDLPEYKMDEKERKKKLAAKFAVQAAPPLREQKKTRKGPPKVRRLLKMQYRKKGQAGEAPINADTLRNAIDPLDFLTKYCIIHPNRLPFYEIIFENMVSEQTPRHESKQSTGDMPETEVTLKTHKKKRSEKKTDIAKDFSEHELKIVKDMMSIHGHTTSDKIGLNSPEQYREKVLYTMESLQEKSLRLESLLNQLDYKRIEMLARNTHHLFPDVCSHDYIPATSKKNKKSKKSHKDKSSPSPPPEEMQVWRRGQPIPDSVIIDRLSEQQLAILNSDSEICQINLERERTQEKIHDVDSRIQQLEGENLLLHILCNKTFFEDQIDNNKPVEFRRQQSGLYKTLHPEPDYELNHDLMEEALQYVNNHLLTDQEFKYLYFILNLPGRNKINFHLFSIIAALSEKVTQMDPVIRDMLNKFDYKALDVKMDKCKELFSLLEGDKMTTPRGGAPAENLALELTAGGLIPEHTNFVLSKFNRDGNGTFDFLDFVTYIPLFIEIHQRIITDPLS